MGHPQSPCLSHTHCSTLLSQYQPHTLPQRSAGRRQSGQQPAADAHTPHSDASFPELPPHLFPCFLPLPGLRSQSGPGLWVWAEVRDVGSGSQNWFVTPAAVLAEPQSGQAYHHHCDRGKCGCAVGSMGLTPELLALDEVTEGCMCRTGFLLAARVETDMA